MDDGRILEFERALWIGKGDVYRKNMSPDCLMVLPEKPYLVRGEDAIKAVENTPRWEQVELNDLQVDRAQEGLIVIAYQAQARRAEEQYTAWCTSTIWKDENDDWKVIQHQQTVPITGVVNE
ncbi:MAG: DUF4440 domain-containing protein [Sphingorhabdus sp.]